MSKFNCFYWLIFMNYDIFIFNIWGFFFFFGRAHAVERNDLIKCMHINFLVYKINFFIMFCFVLLWRRMEMKMNGFCLEIIDIGNILKVWLFLPYCYSHVDVFKCSTECLDFHPAYECPLVSRLEILTMKIIENSLARKICFGPNTLKTNFSKSFTTKLSIKLTKKIFNYQLSNKEKDTHLMTKCPKLNNKILKQNVKMWLIYLEWESE